MFTDLHEIGDMFASLSVPDRMIGSAIVYEGPKSLQVSAQSRLERWAEIRARHEAKRAGKPPRKARRPPARACHRTGR